LELEVYFEARKDFGEEREGGLGGFGRFWEWQGNVVFFALESPEHSRFLYSRSYKSQYLAQKES